MTASYNYDEALLIIRKPGFLTLPSSFHNENNIGTHDQGHVLAWAIYNIKKGCYHMILFFLFQPLNGTKNQACSPTLQTRLKCSSHLTNF